MIVLYLVVLFVKFIRLAYTADIECNVRYEYERLCECKTRYSRYEVVGLPILPPTSSNKYCDNDDLKYHQCYQGTCPIDCENSIRTLNEIDKNDKITQNAGNNICKWAVGSAGITETGLDIWMEYHPGVCDIGRKKLTQSICCNQRCNCGIQLNGNEASYANSTNFFATLPISLKESYYNCSKSEMNQCEVECRSGASAYFNNHQGLKETSVNEFNLFEKDSSLGDTLCASIGKKVLYPGLTAKLIVNTKPGDLSMSKEVNLGTVCCKQQCNCEVLNGNNENVIFQFVDTLKNKTFYECSSEFSNCKKSCLKAVSELFENSLIKDPFSVNTTPEYVNFFRKNPTAGNVLCAKLNKQVTRPGQDIFLKVNSELVNNQPEKIHFGKLCCVRPCKCELVAKNLASGIFTSGANIAYGAKLIKSLDSFLPKRNLSYDCAKEADECINDCRIAAGVFLQNEKIKSPNAPVQSLDIFFEFKAGENVCKAIDMKVKSPGLDVYLRYNTESSAYPFYEDMHVGRICCNSFLFPANKCKYTILPDIDGR